MREYTVREYDAADIELLEEMSDTEIIETLEGIKRGWLPQNYIVAPTPGKTYSEDEYDATRWHAAMRFAIKKLENPVSTSKPIAYKVEKKRVPTDCCGNPEYEINYIVTDGNGNVVFRSKDDPAELIRMFLEE